MPSHNTVDTNPLATPTANSANPFIAKGVVDAQEPAIAVALPPGGLSFEYLQQLAATNPEAALKALALAEAMEKFRIADDEKKTRAKMSLKMVQEVRQIEAATAAMQKGCEMVGHRRKDGSCAIGGQKDSKGNYVLICVTCQKVYNGIGTGPEQLPPQYAAAIDMEYIGG